MKRFTISTFFLGLLAIGWFVICDASTSAAQSTASGLVSGQGKMRFRVLYTSGHLPAEAQKVLTSAHGGFAVDVRPGKGETYFALKGAGIIQISGDLKSTRLLDTAAEMKDTNLHNTTIWYGPDGSPYLEFPGNDAGEVFTTDVNGKLLHALKTPERGTDLGSPIANDYFAGAGNFVPTDVEQVDGLLYMTTGYSNLDFVLTARIVSMHPFQAVWHDLAFGGRGTAVGQFGTAHGITVPPGTKRLDISDRPNSKIDRFTRYGQYLSTLRMPLGSLPCDIYYLGKYAVVGSLDGPDTSKGAPIYLLENDRLISTILPKEELGLTNFKHVHNAVLRDLGGKLYIIAQAWNPGDFAVLEQVTD
ncbi:MAG TPA: hypothetical protein VNY30_24085 [Bryobacteraceae bacterium]|jgi:hypothetical protein|nr:hypothetical protein [Bryobacteraceae bacterium]